MQPAAITSSPRPPQGPIRMPGDHGPHSHLPSRREDPRNQSLSCTPRAPTSRIARRLQRSGLPSQRHAWQGSASLRPRRDWEPPRAHGRPLAGTPRDPRRALQDGARRLTRKADGEPAGSWPPAGRTTSATDTRRPRPPSRRQARPSHVTATPRRWPQPGSSCRQDKVAGPRRHGRLAGRDDGRQPGVIVVMLPRPASSARRVRLATAEQASGRGAVRPSGYVSSVARGGRYVRAGPASSA